MRMRTWAAACVSAVTLATACVIYTGGPKKDARVEGGLGLNGRLYTDQVQFVTGELLWGDSTGYLLLLTGADGRVLWAPAPRVKEVWFPVAELVQVKPTTPAQLEALRSASRFPFGRSQQAIDQIMAQRGQQTVDTLQLPGTPGATAPFLESARAGSARYRSADAAVADGFKRVGTEFPFMGEHWVNLPRVLENSFDASRPSVLIYVNGVKGRELAGVGYTALLAAGEKPPVSPAPASAWHEHNGSVVDESLPGLHHDGGHEGRHGIGHDGGQSGGHKNDNGDNGGNGGNGGTPDGLRLAVMHAWAWTENPAGPFVTDNAALPFARAGIPGRAMSAPALRGLTLVQDSAGYYFQTLRTSLRTSESEDHRLARAIAEARAAAAPDDAALERAWSARWSAIDRELPGRRVELARVRSALERTGH